MEKEREARIAEAEVENLQGSRHQEGLKLQQKLAERRLQIREIQSDGHCMYRAIDDQLATRGQGVGLKELRTQTAKYMRCHADDFLPFLTNTNTGDMFTAGENRCKGRSLGSTGGEGSYATVYNKIILYCYVTLRVLLSYIGHKQMLQYCKTSQCWKAY